MDFSEKRVLITGGSRGIGRAVARAFARRGAKTAISYLSNLEAAKETAGSLPGGPHLFAQADVGDPKAVKRLVDWAVKELGGLDIVVNNAGAHRIHRVEEVDYGEWQAAWRDTLAVNLIGAANVSYCAARHMIERGGGRIVSVSSRGAFRGEPDHPAYGASKAGLNAMSQSLAQRLAPHNIFVGVVAPGYVETDLVAEKLAGPEGDLIRGQSPLGRVARPDEVAQAVLFLAADGSEFMTGAIIDVNGASYLRS
ncbi:MAG: SDR family oxidoreductase [Candidatus Latescibacterota bacterium]|nr:MAG: SDR family oxidoreductase [Candidatus Latescibacterota bacterium]